MPIYEFFSPDTNRIYSFFARSLSQGQKIPRCPDDPKARMERLVSRFAFTGRAREKSEAAGDSLDPRMEQAMAEMEREMAGLDEQNPDPRQLGRMMRKMAAAAGQKMPEVMRQMIERLERGEDPDKLEAEYGDSLEELGEAFGPEQPGEKSGLLKRIRPPRRDPVLYEMRDYVD